MIKLNGVTKKFNEHIIFEKITTTFSGNTVYGLIGENGAGKTTLFKLILEELKPDSGTIEIQNEVVGYLPQNTTTLKSQSVRSFLKELVPHEDEWYKVETALVQVGLENIFLETKTESLSGGQKTKLYLASLLLKDPQPTFLLLDEPTNNLDIEGIEWLENFLLSFNGTILISSHDRSLLDNVAENILELENKTVTSYGGNYSFYREQKEIQREAYERNYIAQQKKIKQIEEGIEAMKKRASHGESQFGSNMPYQRRKIRKSAQQAVHRQHALEKFLGSQKKLEKPEEKIRHFISLRGETPNTKTIIFGQNISYSFGEHKVLENISFHIRGHEHVWLAGLNGSGKTTLLRIIRNELEPSNGSIEIGSNVKIGYFSQDRQDLGPKNTVLEEFMNLELSQTQAYKLALKFNFQMDELSKKIEELSMGQRTKVAFAKLTAGNYELLILDEPTNHLEIQTREIIEAALHDYKGALLISSHDRYFLEKIGIDQIISLHSPYTSLT